MDGKAPGRAGPGFSRLRLGSGRLLLAQIVHEFNQVDGCVPILGGGGMEALLLSIGQAVEGGLRLPYARPAC